MQKDHEWLLEGDSWVEFNTRKHLLRQPDESPEVKATHKHMIEDPRIRQIVTDLQVWPWEALKNHKSAGHPIHKLTFLADIGLKIEDPGMENIIIPILAHQSSEESFQSLMNIPTHFGGSGKDQYSWLLCDTPLLCYSLAKLGLHDDSRVLNAVQYLSDLVRENGWPCAGSKEMGKFRGPGKKEDPCPFATLIMLKLLALYPERHMSEASHFGVECLLDMWQNSYEKHPFLFHMGTDFRKLKAPLVWFDILHVLDVLSQYDFAIQDNRFQEMLATVRAKGDDRGRYTPESIWTVWKGWDFGQKREPSRWLTFVMRKITQRTEDHE